MFRLGLEIIGGEARAALNGMARVARRSGQRPVHGAAQYSGAQVSHAPRGTMAIIPVENYNGQPDKSVRFGPKHLLRAGLQGRLERLGWTTELIPPITEVSGDDNLYGGVRNFPQFSGTNTAVLAAISASTADRVLVLGGSHECALGTSLGFQARFPGIRSVIVDAHMDGNAPHDPEDTSSSPTGNSHGMWLGAAMDPSSYPTMEWMSGVSPLLPQSILGIVGAGSIDTGERYLANLSGIPLIGPEVIERHGIYKICEWMLKSARLNSPAIPPQIHFNLDIDGCSEFRATGTREPFGLTLRELHSLARFFSGDCNPNLASPAMSVWEFNPTLVRRERAAIEADNIIRIIEAWAGMNSTGTVDPLSRDGVVRI